MMRSKLLWRHAALFLGLLFCSGILLSACQPSGGRTNAQMLSPHISPAPPTVDPAARKQGETQLHEFQQWINLLQQNGGDTSLYRQQYSTDQQAIQTATTSPAMQTALHSLQTHIEAIKIPALKAGALLLHNQLTQQVTDWGQQHTYYDPYNQKIYAMGFEYGPLGIDSWSQYEIDTASTVADYQQAIADLQMYLYNFQQMTLNFVDDTPYNLPHQADLRLMSRYGKLNSKVLVVSLQEQAMRIYQNGTLVQAYLVTTGQPDRPTPPGVWWVEDKETNTTFKSNLKPGQPGYYPDTPIDYALLYHSNGYFIHDSWWRNDYGPRKNYPHIDSSGDSFANQGSHGCINMTKADTAWVYSFAQLYTSVIIY